MHAKTLPGTAALALLALAAAGWAEAVRHVEVEGARFAYDEAGEGEAVLFVHGAWSDHRAWEGIRDDVARGHRYIAYTQRHHGTGDWPDDRPLADDVLADDLAALLDHWDEPMHLVGFSSSGSTIFRAAIAAPEHVRSIVIFEPTMPEILAGSPEGEAAVEEWGAGFGPMGEALEAGDNEAAVRHAIEHVFDLPEGGFDTLPEHNRMVLLENASASAPRVRPPGLRRGAAVAAPTPILVGGETQPMWRLAAEAIAGGIPGAGIEVCRASATARRCRQGRRSSTGCSTSSAASAAPEREGASAPGDGADRAAERLEERSRHRVDGRVPLGVPLHRQREARRVPDDQRLGRLVGRPALDDDPGRPLQDPLPVQRVHHDLGRAEHLVEPPALGEPHRMADRELLLERRVGGHAVVHPTRNLADLGVQRAAEGDVELLEPAADAEDRHPARHALVDERQRHGVPVGVEGAVLLGRLVAVVLRVHVRPPAGEDEAVAGLHELGDGGDPRQRRDQERNRAGQVGDRLDVGDAHRLHRVLVVDQMRVADDADDGLDMIPSTASLFRTCT
jgi:pimeloyl-ACP methyl ester carboxylesterase